MGTRAKVRCRSIEKIEGGQFNITLVPVTTGSPENELFYRWTPNGEFKLQVVRESTAETFNVGSEYYVDFTEAIGPDAS